MRSKFQQRRLFEQTLNKIIGCNLKALPTTCLIAADDFNDEASFKRLVADLLAYDCRYFMTYGLVAEVLHDKIDEVISDLELGSKGILTAAHSDEPIDEIAWFFVNATAPEEDCVQYFFGFDDKAAFNELSRAVKKEVQKLNAKFND
ncbi:DUF7684 family protein [Hydrogenophaga sp. BPS33]|uniref:DUF7684 family protein n=1 Tax=Hydrogenophaga sp. BPS33 TaxID=2651974 RepID=UPI0013202CEE|nr:hypothetical protein [Hydrogenophaga sp. BPS33]QHE86275.1 hypothetical protein F9K07_15865 [Hydrogenophaga sp. BPS33]